MRSKIRVWLAVESHHLLSPGVRHAGQNARLGHGRVILVAKNAGNWNSFVAETFHEQTSRLVVSHDPHWQNADAQIGKIVHRVCSAAGKNGAFAMAKDEHRRLARDARDFAEDEFVGDHVAKHGDRDARKSLHNLAQPRGFSRDLAHCSDEFSHAEGLRSPVARTMVSKAAVGSARSMRTRAIAVSPSASICGPKLIASFS